MGLDVEVTEGNKMEYGRISWVPAPVESVAVDR